MSSVALARPAHVRRGVDCAFSTSADSGATCESFSDSWGISVDDLKSLNPSINCPELEPEELYCVIGTVTDEPTTPEPSSSSTIKSQSPVITSSSTPSPITTKLSSTPTFTSTNSDPVIITATSTTSAGNGITTPTPTQPGMVSNCNKFHYVSKGNTCSQIYTYEKVSLADFVKWNPSVKDDCSGLWAEVYVCVGVIGGSAPTTTASTTTTKATTTTTSAGNGVTTPTPTQPGMVGNCAKFHWVAQGTTCSQILSYNKISLADFATWNPSVKADCSGLWANVNVCVGLIGGSPTPTTISTTSTTIQPTKTVGNGIATPTPVQPGMVSNCKKFHYVSEGNVCSQITSYEKISLADFVKWNTGVGSDCSKMWSNTYVCVGV